MAGYDKVILNGEEGDVWTNNSLVPHYQFFVSGTNTCGVCYQYNHAVSIASWPIPIHRGCNCRQMAVKAGDQAKPWVDFRAEIAALDHAQQAACVGASNYQLLKAGAVSWDDVVTKYRVRDFSEVVAVKNFKVETLVKAGVRKAAAERAYESVHTPLHQIIAQKRTTLLNNLQQAGLSRDQVRQVLAGGLASRITGSGPSGKQTFRAGASTDQLVRSYLSMWISQAPIAPAKPAETPPVLVPSGPPVEDSLESSWAFDEEGPQPKDDDE